MKKLFLLLVLFINYDVFAMSEERLMPSGFTKEKRLMLALHDKKRTECQKLEEIKALCADPELDVNKEDALMTCDSLYTPLMVCARENYKKIAEELLKHPRIDVNMTNERNITALDLACCNGRNEIAIMLIHKGANINAANTDGFTPLICATTVCNYVMVKMLVERGAYVNVFFGHDQKKRTVLDQLETFGFLNNEKIQVIDLLKKHGAVKGIDLPD